MKVTWTPLAIERLQEIDAYISQDSPANAANFIALLFERGDSLLRTLLWDLEREQIRRHVEQRTAHR